MEPPEHARATAPGAAGDPLVGRLLDGRYRILARVARGGMASVYEATDTWLDRTVAVKVMHPGLGDDQEFAQRFVRELDEGKHRAGVAAHAEQARAHGASGTPTFFINGERYHGDSDQASLAAALQEALGRA